MFLKEIHVKQSQATVQTFTNINARCWSSTKWSDSND